MGKRASSRITKERTTNLRAKEIELYGEREAELRTLIRLGLVNDNRTLMGEEREHVQTLLGLLKPFAVSNNQRTITEEYHLNNLVYHVTYGLEDEPIIEEIHERTLD